MPSGTEFIKHEFDEAIAIQRSIVDSGKALSTSHPVAAVKRQLSKKTGKEYARIILEDFHGAAEAIVFPESWARLNQVLVEDAAVLLTGGYSARDRDEERAPFVVDGPA